MTQHKVQAIIALVGTALALAPLSSAAATRHYGGGYSHGGGHSYVSHGYSGGHYGGHYGHGGGGHYGYGWGLGALVVGTAAAIITAPLAIASAAISAPYYGPGPYYAPPAQYAPQYAPPQYAPQYAPPGYYDAPPQYAPQQYAPPQYAPPQYAPRQYAPPGYYDAPPQDPNQPGGYYENGR